MRTPTIALALLAGLAACGEAPASDPAAGVARPIGGPEAIVVRVAAGGGPVRAYRYPTLDAPIWASRAPLPAGVTQLGFDADNGTLLVLDRSRRPWRVTLGMGTVSLAGDVPLTFAHQTDGTDVVGVADGTLLRFTTTDVEPWRARADLPPTALAPLRRGALVQVSSAGGRTTLLHWQPPDTAARDTLEVEGRADHVAAAGGDRLFLASGGEVASIRTRDLTLVTRTGIDDSVLALAPTPSGDRLFVLGRDGEDARVTVIDKYTDEITARIAVPPSADALRMDPLGRSLLVRLGGDSVVTIALADNSVGRPFTSAWREDLPQLFPDGRVATLDGDDVILVSPVTGRGNDVVAGGAADIWMQVTWNGFQRGPNEAAAPVRVARADSAARRGDSTARRDSTGRDSTRRDTLARARDAAVARGDTTPPRPPRDSTPRRPPSAPAAAGGFLVQFAALRAEAPARQLAATIRAEGVRARVVATGTGEFTVHRVILGPYPTRADAERAGQAAGRDYWIYDGGRP